VIGIEETPDRKRVIVNWRRHVPLLSTQSSFTAQLRGGYIV